MYFAPSNRLQFERMLQHIELFSPNHEEAGELLETSDLVAMVTGILAMGARAVALRCGASGSIVASADDKTQFCKHNPCIWSV